MIVCQNIGKSYPIGSGQKIVFSGVNLQINPGEKVGLLGRNGAGKSTLIKLIGGVEMPTSGNVLRTMSVSWPLGLGGGFQGGLTGYDNARFIARLYGRSFDEVFEFVHEFTELGNQLKMPVKTYSSGMRARLAFALSLIIEFDCFLVDEVILVGDQNFQRKCQLEFFEKRTDRAMLLASHSPEFIRSYCSRAIVIDKGSATSFDDLEEALFVYDHL